MGIGIIGLGDAGRRHLFAYLKNPFCKIVGVADIDKSKLIYFCKKYKIKFGYTDYTKLLRREDVDIVSIATPPYLHAKISIEAMENDKNVLCEKPICMDENEAEKMIKKERHQKN